MSKKVKEFMISEKEAQRIVDSAMDAGMLTWVSCNSWGNRKKLPMELAEEMFGKDKAAIKASQDLLARDEWRNVTRPLSRARAYVQSVSRPWFTKGVYFTLYTDREEVDETLKKFKNSALLNLEEFIPRLPTLKAEFEKKHPRLYKEANYPTPSQLRRMVNLRWGFIPVIPPNFDGKVPAAVAREEVAKWREQIKEAAEFGIAKTREAFAKIIVHLRDVLKDPDKKFNASTVEKPKEFLTKLKDFDMWGDKPFQRLAKEAEGLLDGVYAEDLKDDAEYRKIIGNAVNEVVKEFEALPTVKMERAIDF